MKRKDYLEYIKTHGAQILNNNKLSEILESSEWIKLDRSMCLTNRDIEKLEAFYDFQVYLMDKFINENNQS